MKIRIVCYDDPYNWICGKFALKLQEHLRLFGCEVDIAFTPDKTADINHHIVWNSWNGEISHNDTLMVTHVDKITGIELMKKNHIPAKLSICMSKEHTERLAQFGLDKNKLCYVNPGQDKNINVAKYVLGFANRRHSDGRKKDEYFIQLADVLDPTLFKWKIMGTEWEKHVKYMEDKGFEVDYYPNFDYKIYTQSFFKDLDYYVYFSADEGQIGAIDAMSAGVKTILIPIGFHLDAQNGITHSFGDYDGLETILLNLQKEKQALINSVSDWTWADYAKKHYELWQHILGQPVQSTYKDGLNSLLEMREKEIVVNPEYVAKITAEMEAEDKRRIIKLVEYEEEIKLNPLCIKKGNWLIKKYKIGNRRIIKILGIFKISYKKRRENEKK